MKKILAILIASLLCLPLMGLALAVEDIINDGEEYSASEFLGGEAIEETVGEAVAEAAEEAPAEYAEQPETAPDIVPEQRVFDYADMLSLEEEQYLNERISSFISQYGYDMGVLTADEGVYDTRDFADTFYEDAGMGAGADRSGVLFFLDMQNRTIWISTAGEMIYIIYDAREEEIFDAQMDQLADGNWAGAFDTALDLTERYINDGVPEQAYIYDEGTGEILEYYEKPELTQQEKTRMAVTSTAGGLLGGGGIGAIVKGIIKKRYSKKYKPVKYDSKGNTSFTIESQNTQLVNKFVTTRVIPRNTNSGRPGGGSFGSGSHSSSGGMRHGGGGRRF